MTATWAWSNESDASEKVVTAAVWVRVVPLFDPAFGDAGQVFDPFTYLAFLAAQTKAIAQATGSAIFSAPSVTWPYDRPAIGWTPGLGIASTVEFPAYGLGHADRGRHWRPSIGS